ncbi:MAG: hypothetical protein GQ574_04460 [Crocinitomix sp.]|nr:hypothetical protein [Crocinitomix sp.]
MRLIFIPLLLLFAHSTLEAETSPKESIELSRSAINQANPLEPLIKGFEEVYCDTLYPGENITVQLWTNYSDKIYNGPNSEFVFLKDEEIVYRDSVYSFVQRFEFEDYNSDGVKDVLIQQYSDVRSNWTYNLYLIDTSLYVPEHIHEFSQIKNPHLNSTKDTITSYIISGDIYYKEFQLTQSKNIVQIGETIITGDPQ